MTCPVIVNADDFGLLDSVNQAIATAHRDGILTSASVLANGPALADALAMARDMPSLGLGVHLALTELKPLTNCPSLAPNGRFPASHGQVFRRFLFGRQDPAQIRDELRAQLERVMRSGLAVDHVDGHGHVHILPAVLEELAPLCREYCIPAIRWPLEESRLQRGSFKAKVKRAVLAGLCSQGEAELGDLCRPAGFYGLLGSGRMVEARLLAVAAELEEAAEPVEIMVHPAMADEAAYSGYLGRQELDALTAPAVVAAFEHRLRFGDLA